MKTLKDYLIEGGREDLIPLMGEWNSPARVVEYGDFIEEVERQHPGLSAAGLDARAGYRWLTIKYPKAEQVPSAESRVPSGESRIPGWAIIAWGVLVLLILGALLARSEPKPHMAITVPQGILHQVGGGPFVQVQNAGSQIKLWAAGIARLNCSTNMTCTYNAGTGAVDMTASSTAGTAWSSLTAPTTNLSLSHSAWTTTFTWNAATGAGVNLFNLTDTLNNTGTGYLLNLNTASGSALKPLRFTAVGTANGVEMTTGALFQAIGSGGINSTQINGVSVTGTPTNGQIPIASSGTAAAWGDPIVSGPTAEGVAPTTNPVFIATKDGGGLIRVPPTINAAPAGTEYGLVVRNIPSGTQTISGTVTGNQGTPSTHANRWPFGLSDGAGFISPATDRTTAAGPFSVRLTDGAAFYDAAKTGQLPTALVGGRLDVNVGNTANTDDAASSATGSAVPAQAGYVGANSSGNLAGIIACDISVAISTAASGSTQLVALSTGQTTYVCSFSFMSAGTTNVKFLYGTGTACGTGPVDLTGAYNTTAQTGVSQGSGLGTLFRTAASNALCINNSAAVQVSGVVSYTKF